MAAGNKHQDSNEIDLVDLLNKIWQKRIFIIKCASIFFILGVVIAIALPKEYASSIVMVPQNGETQNLGGLSSLASLAGVNLSNIGNEQELSPIVYPQVIGSITFQKELMKTQVNFSDIEHPITIFDYYSNDSYKKENAFVKYTLGLPGIISEKLFGQRDTLFNIKQYLTLNKKEKEVCKILNEKVQFKLDEKEGSITLSAFGPEPIVATQMVLAAKNLLQKYITEFKIEKAQINLEFIADRYNESKFEYEKCQSKLASYRDFNRNVISAMTKTQEEKLVNDYNLAYNIYSELAKQLEQAKIKVKDATPVFSVIQPAYVPIEKAKPKRILIIFVFTFFGVVFSLIYIFVKDLLRSIKKQQTAYISS